jgi:hypothetical protein
MAKIELLGTLTNQVKDWIDGLEYRTHQLEGIFLQNDNADKIVEKVVSVGISSTFLLIATSLLAFIGLSIATGLVGGVVFFVIGLLFSKIINRKLFGNMRSVEQLNNEEIALLKESKLAYEDFSKLHKQLKVMAIAPSKVKNSFLFTGYPVARNRIVRVQMLLRNHSPQNLSLKYRTRYNSFAKKYNSILREFDRIYSHS